MENPTKFPVKVFHPIYGIGYPKATVIIDGVKYILTRFKNVIDWVGEKQVELITN